MADIDANVAEQADGTVTETTGTDQANSPEETSAEIARLRADLAKSKAALDKATKEAGDAKKALRARQSAEEQAADAKQEELEELRRQVEELTKDRTVATTSKTIFAFVQDENAANTIANALYGANDIDAALGALSKAWLAKEKALKLEYGKVPAPGVGGSDGPSITREELDAMTLSKRIEFANAHPDDYNKLLGR